MNWSKTTTARRIWARIEEPDGHANYVEVNAVLAVECAANDQAWAARSGTLEATGKCLVHLDNGTALLSSLSPDAWMAQFDAAIRRSVEGTG